jgi:hypothetical protein
MKRNAWFGLLLYVMFLGVSGRQLQVLEAVLMLAVLVLVPGFLMLVDARLRNGKTMALYKIMTILYPPAAVCAALSFMGDIPLLCLPWVAFTVITALYGLRRLLERGLHPLAETAVDFGLMYLAGGGFWFLAASLHWRIMDFSDVLIMLTAVHFHYSSFIIPILAGLLGRKITVGRKLYLTSTVIIMLAPAGIALGIAFSTALEFILVAAYLAAVYSYGLLVFKASFTRREAKYLISFSALVLMVTILFSLIYAAGRAMGFGSLSINRMIWIHGLMNAVGVALPSLAGWLLEGNFPKESYYGKPVSSITGGRHIGRHFLSREGLLDETASYSGLVDRIDGYDSASFRARRLSPVIRDFYEHTDQYAMRADIRWAGWFRPLAVVYQVISRRIGQIHLGTFKGWQGMYGRVLPVASGRDGRQRVRAWQRLNGQGEAIFIALYSLHWFGDEPYMNIALPLPGTNMTGMLRLYNEGSGLVLTSAHSPAHRGDEGIYLHASWFTMRLPLKETFWIREGESGQRLTARHRMWIFGLRFLDIRYDIQRSG